ncbi:glycosyltransferase family 4 protein [Azonexus sp. IMCC34839]|uniref:glycosyltransferase family 4 protein n=1 Tax=Azonexus sp. IMCC34839 TaxID=3133695 RepID=UPI00399AB0EB
MKIAIVRQRYNPYGGAERFVERALSALAGEGAEVTLITRNWEGAPRAGFRQITCDPSYSRLFGGRAARDKSFAAAVQAEWARGHFDITQSHERIPGCMIFRAGDGVHAAWLEHRACVLGPLQRLSQGWSAYHRYVCGSEKAMFEHPALRTVICNSQMVADEICRFYHVHRSKLQVIYNGVDTTVFHPGLADEFRSATRAAAGIPEDVPVLLYVGSGFERKGVPQLLQAAARMQRQDARIVIVGADRKLKAEQKRAASLGLADRVTFTGPLKDVRPWYGAADGFVLPTLYDPCPNAALEALASGLPIVTSTTCGAQEWVRAGENGWVVDALAIDELAGHLDDLAGLAGNAEARAAARAVAEPLTLEAMAGRLLDLYRSLGGASSQQV